MTKNCKIKLGLKTKIGLKKWTLSTGQVLKSKYQKAGDSKNVLSQEQVTFNIIKTPKPPKPYHITENFVSVKTKTFYVMYKEQKLNYLWISQYNRETHSETIPNYEELSPT